MFRVGANWQLLSQADGAPYPAADVTQPGPRYDWTGMYAGGHVGWGGLVTDGLYNPNVDGAADPTANEAIDLSGVNDLGVLGGGQLGFNWQVGSLVLGLEGDIAGFNWDGRETEFAHPSDRIDFNSDYLATARARVGYADDNLLFYATAGLAFVDAELDNTANEGGKNRNIDAVGGAAGLGMEWGITQSLSAKVDGLFVFFDDTTGIQHIGNEGDRGDFFQIDDGFLVRVGANWRFNPLGTNWD